MMSRREKSTFKSYITQHDEESTFTTYIPYDDIRDSILYPENRESASENLELSVSMSSDYLETFADPVLLPGERIIAQAENVLRFSSFTGKKQGLSGALYVTNYKITFITAISSEQVKQQNDRNLLINDMDISLAGIDTIYQGFSGGKRKKIHPGCTISSKSKYLYVYCKNLKLHQFSFKFTPKQQDRQVINAIVAFSFPSRPELLFALQYAQNTKAPANNIPTFATQEDWDSELDRLNCKGWRTIEANTSYLMCTSLPQCFVVPQSIVVAELREASQYYVENRPPVWSYSVSNGASLVRLPYLESDSNYNELNNKFIQAMTMSSPCMTPPTVFDLGKLCPGERDLHQNFEKLKEILMFDSVKQFWDSDNGWYTQLENTHWLEAVQSCLQVASEISIELVERRNSVLIKEHTSRDTCCVVASLVQLMIDRHYRTINGFQALIQKEWVAMGHPFQRRHGIVKYDPTLQSPVFLLFLDCVWQLTEQFRTDFEFTDTYLVSLWDSTHLGLFKEFLFDSLYEHDKFCSQGGSYYKTHLPSVWNWDAQFRSEELTLFKNPLYFIKPKMMNWNRDKSDSNCNLRRMQSPGSPVQNATERQTNSPRIASLFLSPETMINSLGYHIKSATNPPRARTLEKQVFNSTDQVCYSSPKECEERLKPNCSLTGLKLWCLCYIRWLAPSEIINGGKQSEYIQQCFLVEEVISLQHQVDVLHARTRATKEVDVLRARVNAAHRPHSGFIFGQDNVNSSRILQSAMITSSFPYSTASPRGQQQFVFMPLITYLDNSSIKCDYSNCDD